MPTCPKCKATLPAGAIRCSSCGAFKPGHALKASEANDTVATVIPYRNVPALISYYTGVFSLIPCIGLFLSLVAIPTGIHGLGVARDRPSAHGRAHAIVGLVLGTLVLIGHIVLLALMLSSR